MDRRLLLISLALPLLAACSSTKFAKLQFIPVKQADHERIQSWPATGSRVTVELGESMIKTYSVATLPAMKVAYRFRHITNYRETLRMALDIPAGDLELAGTDENGGKYYAAEPGVELSYESKGAFADPEVLKGGIHVATNGTTSVFWFWPEDAVPNLSPAAELKVAPATVQRPPREAAFQRELVYSGTSQSTLSLLYREFKDNMARPAFSQDLKYDIAKSSVVGFKGSRFEIIEAGNTSITYRILTPLP